MDLQHISQRSNCNARAFDAKVSGVAINFVAHIRGYDAEAAFNNIGSANPTNDLAYFTAKVDIPTTGLSPVVVFADEQAVSGFLSNRIVTRTGSGSAPSSGAFDGWKAPGEFGAKTKAIKGDSGGPASIELNDASYIVGVLSTTYKSSGEDAARYSYLDPQAYAKLDTALVGNGATTATYAGMTPDLIVGGSTDGKNFKGGVRPSASCSGATTTSCSPDRA